LTDADHFGMIRTAQRRFAPTVIDIFGIRTRWIASASLAAAG
jgi:hypothetical protein